MAAADTNAKLGSDFGADVCARKGIILSRPGARQSINDNLVRESAQDCGGYMLAFEKLDHYPNQVGMGDVNIAVEMSATVITGDDKPTLCLQCKWFVPPKVVHEETGWTLGMCAAKGRLLFSTHYNREASLCGEGIIGTNRETTDGVNLMPIYEVPVSISKKPQQPIAVKRATLQADPREYPTDRPVTPAEAAAHIRAWRLIPDPEGLHDAVEMPIFHGEALCGYDPRITYGQHRPDLYIDHAGLLYDLMTEWLRYDATPVVIGGAGTGKTELFCYAAYMMDLPFTRLSVSKGTEEYHFYGEKSLVTVTDAMGETHTVTTFVKGRFVEAITKPGVAVVDEPNLKSDIFELLRPVFDSAGQIVIDAAQGSVMNKDDLCFLGCAQNPSWDPLYIGTEPMSAADMDRVSPIFVDLPPDDIERDIIVAHCKDRGYDIEKSTLDYLMLIAGDLRTLIADGTLPIAWGIRSQIKVALKTQYYSFEKAYRRAIIDGLEQAYVDVIVASVSSIVSASGSRRKPS